MKLVRLVLMLSLSCTFTFSAYAQEALKFSTFPTSVRAIVFKEILTEAYHKIGIKITVAPYPARRGIENANAGILDGEAGRLAHVGPLYPNLLMVPVPKSKWNEKEN